MESLSSLGAFMSRKKKSPARPRSLGKKLTLKKVSVKQAAFLKHFTDPKSPGFGNATRAAELAGYRGAPGSNQLSVQGHRILENPSILDGLAMALQKQGFSLEFPARVLMEAMHATKVQVVPNNQGKMRQVRWPDHRTRLQAFDRVLRVLGGNTRDAANPWAMYQMLCGGEQAGLNPIARSMSEEAKKLRAEFDSCSRADRMLMYEGLSAVLRVSEMLKQNPELRKKDLEDNQSQPDPGQSAPSDGQK